MEMLIDVPDFDGSLHMVWEPNAEMEAIVKEEIVHIRANRAGLISLARLMLTLVDDRIDDGSHWHLDPAPVGNLEPGSLGLIVGRENS